MPISSYQCSVTVEIAFTAGFGKAAAARTWVDVSDYVELAEGITITCGRQDERSAADANHLTLVLDNRDGRFTPGKSTSPYYPDVRLDRAIRVTSDPVDGAASTRFVGLVDEWPVEWEGTDGYAKVTISASSRMSRLGLQAGLKSIVESVVLADSPIAYYTMAEPAGATQANDSSGNRADPLILAGDSTLPVVFGTATGPGTDSLTAVDFAAGQYLKGWQTPTLTAVTWEAFFTFTGTAVGTFHIGGIDGLFYLQLKADGEVSVVNAAGTSVLTATGQLWADALTHHYAMTVTGTTWTLYVDGVSAATTASSAISASGAVLAGYGPLQGAVTGSMAHEAVFSTALSAARILAHAQAGLTGYAGETTSVRLLRYAALAGIAAADVSAETGQTTVGHLDTTDKQAIDLMRSMESTEGGVLFDHRDGTLMFQNRGHRLTAAAVYTLDMAQHMVEANYSPKLDRTALANDVTAQNTAGTVTAHVFDGPVTLAATSMYEYGVATLSIETASEDDDEPLFQAGWALYKYKTPLSRVASLSVDALAQVGKTPSCFTVMATNLGDKITVSNRPTQDASTSGSFFVEGYTEVYGPESLTFTFNVSPSSPEDTTYVCGDASRGVVGTNPIAL